MINRDFAENIGYRPPSYFTWSNGKVGTIYEPTDHRGTLFFYDTDPGKDEHEEPQPLASGFVRYYLTRQTYRGHGSEQPYTWEELAPIYLADQMKQFKAKARRVNPVFTDKELNDLFKQQHYKAEQARMEESRAVCDCLDKAAADELQSVAQCYMKYLLKMGYGKAKIYTEPFLTVCSAEHWDKDKARNALNRAEKLRYIQYDPDSKTYRRTKELSKTLYAYFIDCLYDGHEDKAAAARFFHYDDDDETSSKEVTKSDLSRDIGHIRDNKTKKPRNCQKIDSLFMK